MEIKMSAYTYISMQCTTISNYSICMWIQYLTLERRLRDPAINVDDSSYSRMASAEYPHQF